MADDGWIINGLRSGDVRAWNAVYERFARLVWRDVARRLGPNSSDICDVVQEVFLDAARSAHTFRSSEGSLSQWLRGITYRKVALYWRKRARQNDFAHDDVATLVVWLGGDEQPPPAILESAELVDAVRDTLAHMSPKYVEVLMRKYLDNQSVRSIAIELNTTASAIESQLKRARQQFKTKFTELHKSAQIESHSTRSSR